eukprot:scaffold38_cov67-Phaeocystis_antarctica.AAC.4
MAREYLPPSAPTLQGRAHSGGCSPFDLAIRICKLGVGDDHAGEGSDDGHHVTALIPREEGGGDRRDQ